jgi:hypothetical protein
MPAVHINDADGGGSQVQIGAAGVLVGAPRAHGDEGDLEVR